MADQTSKWTESYLVVAAARIASILGTILAAISIWIFQGMWSDVRELSKGISSLNTQVQIQGVRIEALTTRNDDQDRRIVRIEGKVFP
tara:strand:- start:975 stop:1238 length:264 start_codon:yes stop_codon:yes gene_type:complete